MYFLPNFQRLMILSVKFTILIKQCISWLFSGPTHFEWNKDIQNLRQTAAPKIYRDRQVWIKTVTTYQSGNSLAGTSMGIRDRGNSGSNWWITTG